MLLHMLHRLLIFLRRPRATDILHRQRVQFARIQEDLRTVIDRLQSDDDFTIEDLGQE